MDKKLYVLKDGGDDIFDARLMDQNEFGEAQEKADAATDGSFYWVEIDPNAPDRIAELLQRQYNDRAQELTELLREQENLTQALAGDLIDAAIEVHILSRERVSAHDQRGHYGAFIDCPSYSCIKARQDIRKAKAFGS